MRNPLSAAISANTFVGACIQAEGPITEEEKEMHLREDTVIIHNSLRFIDDLLRSMLDVHRASHNKMLLDENALSIVSLMEDILEPVASMIYQRDTNFDVRVECPKTLLVRADRLRLTQVVLNLARNSSKFVQTGFVRLRAAVVESSARIYVEDSGPGIPEEKKADLFSNKFQASLDTLAVRVRGCEIQAVSCFNSNEILLLRVARDWSWTMSLQKARRSNGRRTLARRNLR